jgi:serine protease Do
VQKITPEIADSLGLNQQRGALVADVTRGSPAERAGIKTGDIITGFNSKPVRDSAELPSMVANVAPGTAATIKVLRDGKEITLPITVGEMQDSEVATKVGEEGDLGLAVQPVTPEIAQNLGLDRAEGLVITEVKPGSAADDAGLQQGDLITEVNRHPVNNLAEYNREMAQSKKGKSVLLLVRRGQSSVFLALKR